LGNEVQLEDAIDFGEDEGIDFTIGVLFEVEVHADLFEEWNFFQDNSVLLLVSKSILVLVPILIENE